METSKKYKEIFRLKKMLEDANIPFDFFELDPEARKIMPEFEESAQKDVVPVSEASVEKSHAVTDISNNDIMCARFIRRI